MDRGWLMDRWVLKTTRNTVSNRIRSQYVTIFLKRGYLLEHILRKPLVGLAWTALHCATLHRTFARLQRCNRKLLCQKQDPKGKLDLSEMFWVLTKSRLNIEIPWLPRKSGGSVESAARSPFCSSSMWQPESSSEVGNCFRGGASPVRGRLHMRRKFTSLVAVCARLNCHLKRKCVIFGKQNNTL